MFKKSIYFYICFHLIICLIFIAIEMLQKVSFANKETLIILIITLILVVNIITVYNYFIRQKTSVKFLTETFLLITIIIFALLINYLFLIRINNQNIYFLFIFSYFLLHSCWLLFIVFRKPRWFSVPKGT